MPAILTVHDETATGTMLHEFRVEFPTERTTVRELIRERVYQEVRNYNLNRHSGVREFRGLVQPHDAEQTLNGIRPRKERDIDWKQQFDKAIDAFGRNGFVLLVDDKQVESLDEEILIDPATRVSFVRLVPLVGG